MNTVDFQERYRTAFIHAHRISASKYQTPNNTLNNNSAILYLSKKHNIPLIISTDGGKSQGLDNYAIGSASTVVGIPLPTRNRT